MTPPAKKAVPSLSDLTKEKNLEVEVQEENDPGHLEDAAAQDETKDNDFDLVDPHKDHVHTWEEDHDQNLARVQKDVTPAQPPSEHAGVTKVVSENVYANVADVDDTGRTV